MISRILGGNSAALGSARSRLRLRPSTRSARSVIPRSCVVREPRDEWRGLDAHLGRRWACRCSTTIENVKKAIRCPLATSAFNTSDVAVDTSFWKGNNRNAYPACFNASFEPHALCDDLRCCGGFVGECPMPVWCTVCLTLRSFAPGSDACRRRNRKSSRVHVSPSSVLAPSKPISRLLR